MATRPQEFSPFNDRDANSVMDALTEANEHIAELTDERAALCAQVAALTPTAEQVKRRELAELALGVREAHDAYEAELGRDAMNFSKRAKLLENFGAANRAYIAARDAAKGGREPITDRA